MNYKYHETEICHNGRLGCWVKSESVKDLAIRLGRCILEMVALGIISFGLCALCALA